MKNTITKGLLYFILAIVAAVTLAAIAEAVGGIYTQAVPQAQKVYNGALHGLCEAEKNLAIAKLNDWNAGELKLEPDQVKTLAEKKEAVCGF